jgi:hypothetical protein
MKKTSRAKKGKAIKPAGKKPPLMEIHESLERIREKELCDMNLFELSIHSLMQTDTFREIRNRLKLVQASLEIGDTKAAKIIINGLVGPPPENPFKKGGV